MSKATPINCSKCGQLIGKSRPVEDLFDPSELRAMSVEAANEYVASIAQQVIQLKAENRRLQSIQFTDPEHTSWIIEWHAHGYWIIRNKTETKWVRGDNLHELINTLAEEYPHVEPKEKKRKR